MRRMLVFSLAASLPVVALPSLAQQKPGNIARVFVSVPRPGMAQQYEEGRKRHMDWHRKQNDLWTWETWQVETGEGSGAYLTITEGHHWKDFDAWEAKFAKGDDADAALNLAPHIGGGTNGFWAYLADVSRPAESKEPPKMAQVIHFIVKPEAEEEFFQAIKRIHEGIVKINWPPRYVWHALVNGGEQPHFVVVLPRNSWAEMAEPEVSFEAMLEKAFGRYEAGSLTRSLTKTIGRQWSEMLTYRSELSYRPTAK